MSLRQIARRDRLDELTFELPLAGGKPARHVLHDATSPTSFAVTLAADDPVGRLCRPARGPGARTRSLRGYLTGSIDLVFRFSGHRLAIVDYKTNRLASPAGGAQRRGTTGQKRLRTRCTVPTTRSRRSSTPSLSTATCGGAIPATRHGETSPVFSISSCGE